MASFFIQSSGIHNSINLNFLTTTLTHHHRSTSASAHSILTFAAVVLVNFLELKYQGKSESPFETHPKTMFLAVGSLIAYCVAYDVKSRFNRRDRVKNVCVFGGLMAAFGSVSLAALFSVLLPWFLSPILFSLSALFSLSQLPFLSLIRESIRDEALLPTTATRLRRAGSVNPWRFLENVLADEEERNILPL